MEPGENTATSQEYDSFIATNYKNANEKIYSVEKLPYPVYYVESPNDDTVLIGLDVKVLREKKNNKESTTVSWHDTNHYRHMEALNTISYENRFAFKRRQEEGGSTYYFVPMTLNIYNSKVKKLVAGSPNYASEQELIDGLQSAAADEF